MAAKYYTHMAQNIQGNIAKRCNPTLSEAEEVKESIERKELQNSILRILVREIRKSDTPTNTDEESTNLKDKTSRTC